MKNYFKVAWRNLLKNKLLSFINIVGLSVGLTCCILISLYIKNELSYDQYHNNSSRIYQLAAELRLSDKTRIIATVPAPMAAIMKREFPEIEASARLLNLFQDDKTLIQYDGPGSERKSFYETEGYLTDPAFFRLFTYNFTEGGAFTALNRPNTVVLSEEIAKKLFGNQPAINKTIKISSNTNGNTNLTVTGVFKPTNKPSHLNGRFFISFSGGRMDEYIKTLGNDMVSNNMFYTYFLLRQGADYEKLESKFKNFEEKYISKDLKTAGFSKRHFLTPLSNIHLDSPSETNVTPNGNKTYLFIFSSVALFILLIACINFMNLSTANSSRRATEVGIRKVLGAQKASLKVQFLSESIIIAFISLALSLLITSILLPSFNHIAAKNLALFSSDNTVLFGAFILLTFITGLLAGSYPAYYLSSFASVKVLKGKLINSLGAASLRRALVVFQFIISVTLIISSVVISKQLNYLQSKDPGFEKDHQLIIPLRSEQAKAMQRVLKNEIRKNPIVESVGASFYYPGIFNGGDDRWYKEGQTINEAVLTKRNTVDPDYMKTLGITLLAGRNLAESDTSSNHIVLNEKAIMQIGFKSANEAIGQKIYNNFRGQVYNDEIVGVVKDFNFESLQVPIQPLALVAGNSSFNYLIVHTSSGKTNELITSIGTAWNKFIPDEPFDYSFLDSDFQKNYEADNSLFTVIRSFTLIAIIISCLGLFGLATFMAEQRTKEIGIRKVLGASIAEIVTLLSSDFLKLVLVAVIIACPIGWYLMDVWLREFAYHITITWWVFVLTLFLSLAISFMTIGLKAVKAALANPVKSLRTE